MCYHSVIRVQNGDSFERICDKCLALIFVRLKKKYHYFPFTQLLILISPPSFSRRSPIAKALVGGGGWLEVSFLILTSVSAVSGKVL